MKIQSNHNQSVVIPCQEKTYFASRMDKEASLCALAALKRDATEEDNFKLMVLFQQCSNRLREVEATGFSEAELGDIPGFSEFVICAIKKKFESKRKTGEEQDRGGPKKKLKGILSTMQDKLDDKEPEKESEVPKYLPKEGTPAFAIIRALRNEIPHCLQKDELKEAAQPFCAESFKETGSSSAWEATTILLKKKIISKSKKGSSEFYTLTEKGEELADLMGADEEDSRILINDLKLIGIEAAFMQKAIVRAFRSKASLVETLREREAVEQKMNVLRQTPLDDSRVIPRYICSKLIDHFVP